MWSRDGNIKWVCPEVLCNELDAYEADITIYGVSMRHWGVSSPIILWEQTLPLIESHLTLQVIPRGGKSNADPNTYSPPAP